MPIKVAVSGTGKMGREVLLAVCREPDLEPVGVLARSAAEEYLSLPDGLGLVPFAATPVDLFARTRPEVLIDFTNADWTPDVVRLALDAGVRPVIGTSGLRPSFLEELARECRKRGIGGVVAANFAIGAVLMIYLAGIASRFFDHVEIVEMHHDQKADAPSGTSIATVQILNEGRDRSFQYANAEKELLPGSRGAEANGVAIHSVRLPGLVAHQQVIFGGSGQTLTIRHDTVSRESFVSGVCLAARKVMEREELVVGLERLIGLKE